MNVPTDEPSAFFKLVAQGITITLQIYTDKWSRIAAKSLIIALLTKASSVTVKVRCCLGCGVWGVGEGNVFGVKYGMRVVGLVVCDVVCEMVCDVVCVMWCVIWCVSVLRVSVLRVSVLRVSVLRVSVLRMCVHPHTYSCECITVCEYAWVIMSDSGTHLSFLHTPM